MRITVNEFVELDTSQATLVTDAWFHISWRDELLTWDPNDYQQLKQIHLSPNEIWKPDIVLINTAQQDNLLGQFADSELLVNSTGDVLWITMGLLRSKCPILPQDYPYTIRPISCRLIFCSLIYQSSEVNITTPGNEFYVAGPWFVNPRLRYLNMTGERYERFYEGYGTYSFESLTVQLQRRDNTLPLLIRIPTLTAIVLTLCMFFLPINWPVRIHLALVALLIQLLLILYIGLQLGTNAIGLARPISYLRDDLFLATLALVMTLVFRRLLVLADSLPPVPYVLSSFLSGPVARLLCFAISTAEYTTKPPPTARSALQARSPFDSTAKLAAGRSKSRSSLGDHVSLVEESDEAPANEPARVGPIAHQTTLDMSPSEPYDSANQAFEQVVFLTGGQFEWMQMVIFLDRIMFVFYALIMVPRLL